MRGKKVENLERLKERGLPVPDFLVVDRETDIDGLPIPWRLCAVRSAVSVEDGERQSFAGQFDTYLNVPAEEVPGRVRQCFASMKKKSAQAYADSRQISLSGADMQVIVQEMVAAEYSGVLFTANPRGLLNETVIAVGEGTGDGVVEDRTDTTVYYWHQTEKVYYYEGGKDYLSRGMLERLVKLSGEICSFLGEFLDIEFAIAGEEIYLLQARPITTLLADDPLIMDNSNIVESYPGISLPLTCSFVHSVYSGIFKSVSRRILHNDRELAKYEKVFTDMVGSVNGRLYYKISNWYTVIKFLPMSSRIIPIWQEMLGVKIKQYDEERVELPLLVRAKTYWNVLVEMLHVPRNMKRLNEDFQKLNRDFYQKRTKDMSAGELIKQYRSLQDTLLSCWDVTLLNDVYAFVFTALVKRRMGEEGNRILSGISNLESMKPVRELVRLAREKRQLSPEQYRQRFDAYIREYGDRSLEELKLESRTFRTHPELLEEQIDRYEKDPEKLEEMYAALWGERDGEGEDSETVPGKGMAARRGIDRLLAREAARGIANREISRLNRSRIFGMVREIFLGLGELLVRAGLAESPRDIFWLTLEEVFGAAEELAEAENSLSDKNKTDLAARIARRREDYEIYACLPAYQRLIFAGKEFDKHHRSVNAHRPQQDAAGLQGTPCSDGVAEGEVLVVTDVKEVTDCRDKILVTKMTDPGWVFLLVCARGIISEKGSLLSHTAIISRELKIPSIVGVDGVTDILRTGDLVRMDAGIGRIQIIRRNEEVQRPE